MAEGRKEVTEFFVNKLYFGVLESKFTQPSCIFYTSLEKCKYLQGPMLFKNFV